MLELDVLEQRPVNPLESSVSRTVTNKCPVLLAPFIHEHKIGPDPISDLGHLDHVTRQDNVQETNYSLAEVREDTKIIPEPALVSCARKKDTGELYIVNSAVMLDTVEKVTPMEICDSAQNMILQESGESSDLQIREDFLEITVARDLTNQLYMKDGHTVSDPVSKMNDKAAGMEVMGTGAVLQSEQSERVGDLPNEPKRDESSGLEISDSVSLAATKANTLIDESPEGFLHDECTVLMSSIHQCTDCNTRERDSVKCLEVEHLPCLQSTSTGRTTSFNETSSCRGSEFACINEVGSATCLLERQEPNTTDNINVPRDKDLDMSVEAIHQEIKTTSSDENQNNDLLVPYLSETISAETSSTRLQDVQSDTSEAGLLLYDKSLIENDRTSPGNLEDDLSFKPNLPPCFENLTSAKTIDTEECSFSSSMSDCNTPLSDDAPDCHKSSSDPSPQNILCSPPLTSIFEERSYTKSRSTLFSVVCSETPSIEFNSHTRDSELDGETKEQLSMSVAPCNGLDKDVRIAELDLSSNCLSMETEENQCTIPQTKKLHLLERTGKLAVTQSQGLYGMVPTVISDQTTSLKIVEDSHCSVDTEDFSCKLSDSNAVIHDVTSCNEAMTSSHMQSSLLVTIRETVLTSDCLEVPCQTEGYCTDETQSYALVPYIDIWSSLSKPEVNTLLSLREPKTVISKNVESQELKEAKDVLKGSVNEGYLLEETPEASMEEDCILKAFKNPQEVVDLSHFGGKYKEDEPVLDSFSKMDALLAQEVKCNVFMDSIACHAECRSIKMHDSRIVPSTINQAEGICHVNSGALCDFSVPLDVHNICVLPQLVDVKSAGDALQSENHLSLSNKHLGECSALIIPTSLPASTVAPTESKNRAKSHSEVFLGNLQLHAANHTDSSVQIQDNQSKSVLIKQDAELGPGHSTTLKEPFKASDSVQCMQISAAEVNGPSVQPAVLNENRSPFMLHIENVSPGKVVFAIKTEAARVKSQRNVCNAEIKVSEKSLKERPRQSVGCHMEMLSVTTGNRKKYSLRPPPQSLNCSTSQEAKRPKLYNGKDVSPATSGQSNCVKFSQKSESHHLSQPRQAYKRKEPPSAIRNDSCLGTAISGKIQPNRKCKRFSTQANLLTNSTTQMCKSSPALKIHNSHDINIEYKSLPSKHVDLKLISKPRYSKVTRRGAVSQKPTHLLKCTQDQMLLNKLSKIANRLTAPSKASCKSKTFSSSLKVIPFRGVKIQARKLRNVFSCANMRMKSQPGQIWQENVCLTSSRDRLVSQSISLYPASFPKTCLSSLGDPFSFNACDNLTFPVSFHVNVDPSCLSDFLKCNPPDFILRSPQPTVQSSELSEWTLSLFLSSHVPADTENVHLLTPRSPQFRALESSSESSHTRKSVRQSECSMLGLHTVLALSSPGCYRLWTRRRNLGSRIPTVQKLSMTQFAHGLKGSPPQLSRGRGQFSSLAFSLGRILSTWSQHGLSAFSSDCANTHPNCSVSLPGQNSNIISMCRSPNPLVCVPQLHLNTIPQLNTHSIPVQNFNLTLKPRICHQEQPGFCLSTQQKDDPRPLYWLSSAYKNDVELSSCSIKQEAAPNLSFIFSTGKEDKLNLPLHPSTQQKNNLERPLGLSYLKHDLKPVVNISLVKDTNPTICLDTRCDVYIQKDAAVGLPCPESLSKGQACPFEQRENIIIPCTKSGNKDQANENGSCERKPQRVSQIRIRKTIPKPDPNLTPMGLPKPKRVNKKEFSLEDIYTNKNYKSPPPARSLETIFEEPKEKNGVLISVSQQKRKRILEFRDCTVPRLKRPKGKMKVMTSCKRGRKAAMEGVQLDALLIQKLMDLENCLLEEEAMEKGSAASEMPS